MQPVEYQDGWVKATPRQVELEKPILEAFKKRNYNNTLNKAVVYNGVDRKPRRK